MLLAHESLGEDSKRYALVRKFGNTSTMVRRAAALSTCAQRPRYLEPFVPVIFPEEAELPETQLHLDLRTLLYHLLSDYLGLEATVGSEQFVYFDASDPKQVVAPDVLVRLDPRGDKIRSWKTWERGAPEVAVPAPRRDRSLKRESSSSKPKCDASRVRNSLPSTPGKHKTNCSESLHPDRAARY